MERQRSACYECPCAQSLNFSLNKKRADITSHEDICSLFILSSVLQIRLYFMPRPFEGDHTFQSLFQGLRQVSAADAVKEAQATIENASN